MKARPGPEQEAERGVLSSLWTLSAGSFLSAEDPPMSGLFWAALGWDHIKPSVERTFGVQRIHTQVILTPRSSFAQTGPTGGLSRVGG